MKFIYFLLIVFFPLSVKAGWFGPSNYEECVIEGVKTAKNQAAVAAVNNACNLKFNSNLEYDQQFLFSSLSSFRPALNALLAKIEILGMGIKKSEYVDINFYVKKDVKEYLGVQVMNRNDFSISGIEVGVTKFNLSNCSPYLNDYNLVVACSGNAEPRRASEFGCVFPGVDINKISGLCITGFYYYDSASNVNKFMKNYKIPKNN